MAIVQATTARAKDVYQAIAIWLETNQPCTHHTAARATNILRYAGETLVASSARPVPIFAKRSQADAAYDEDSEHICHKHYEGKKTAKPRCMLFLHVCLDHGAICHYHLTRAEGRRDMMLPIYRSWRRLPTLIVYDYACGYVFHVYFID